MTEVPYVARPPLATSGHYDDGFSPLPSHLASKIEGLIARAERKVRAECSEVDAKIAAGEIDPDLVADIVCEIVERATRAPAGLPAEAASYQQGAGPYQATVTFADAVGRMFVSKDAKRLLGCGRQVAFTVSMTTPLDDEDA